MLAKNYKFERGEVYKTPPKGEVREILLSFIFQNKSGHQGSYRGDGDRLAEIYPP